MNDAKQLDEEIEALNIIAMNFDKLFVPIVRYFLINAIADKFCSTIQLFYYSSHRHHRFLKK